jgi:hypothetical protein
MQVGVLRGWISLDCEGEPDIKGVSFETRPLRAAEFEQRPADFALRTGGPLRITPGRWSSTEVELLSIDGFEGEASWKVEGVPGGVTAQPTVTVVRRDPEQSPGHGGSSGARRRLQPANQGYRGHTRPHRAADPHRGPASAGIRRH